MIETIDVFYFTIILAMIWIYFDYRLSKKENKKKETITKTIYLIIGVLLLPNLDNITACCMGDGCCGFTYTTTTTNHVSAVVRERQKLNNPTTTTTIPSHYLINWYNNKINIRSWLIK